jgi:DNA-binding transcriptional LysR family regulator
MDPLVDDLLGLLSFARVVEHRSFTKAAAALGLSKSVVSSKVSALETRLGERLLVRTTRKLAVTDAGLGVYEHCRRMIESAGLAIRDASDVNRGVIRLSAPVAFAERYLAEPLARFAAAEPAVMVEVMASDRLVDLVEERIDLAIRITKLTSSSLVARKLASTAIHVCGSPAYLRARGRPERPEDLLRHNCLRYSLLRREDEWRLYGKEGRIQVPVRGTFAASSGAILREAAIGGLGLAVLPRFLIHEALASGALETVLDEHAPRPIGIYAVQPGERARPARIGRLVELLAKRFRRAPWA